MIKTKLSLSLYQHVLSKLTVFDRSELGPFDGGYWIGFDDPNDGEITIASVRLGCEEALGFMSAKDLEPIAHLFAASPRLLECLRELANRCAKLPASQKSVGFQQEIQLALEAIAQAEGRDGK